MVHKPDNLKNLVTMLHCHKTEDPWLFDKKCIAFSTKQKDEIWQKIR